MASEDSEESEGRAPHREASERAEAHRAEKQDHLHHPPLGRTHGDRGGRVHPREPTARRERKSEPEPVSTFDPLVREAEPPLLNGSEPVRASRGARDPLRRELRFATARPKCGSITHTRRSALVRITAVTRSARAASTSLTSDDATSAQPRAASSSTAPPCWSPEASRLSRLRSSWRRRRRRSPPSWRLATALVAWHQAVLRWPAVVALILSIMLFVPIGRYSIPVNLPFDLELYRACGGPRPRCLGRLSSR